VNRLIPALWLRRGLFPSVLFVLCLHGRAQAPSSPAEDEEEVVELEPVEVLGSRIRLVEVSGPSPTSVYGTEDIAQAGALTLADFLNRLPQNYSGISAGRGSTPNELNPDFGSRTETANAPFNLAVGTFSPPANATGQAGVSLRGLGSGATLVLVDGRRMAKSSVGNQGTDSRQGYVDLNSIPLGMVERVEVITDGASALYGADAVAGVINIVLKKNWSGTELSSSFKGAFAGGGGELTSSLVHGFSAGKLRGSVSLDYYQRNPLKANERPFSARQDHTAIVKGHATETGEPIFGSDYRVNWGYPATVQARSGFLDGILDPAGRPTRVALTPAGLTSTPTTLEGFVGVAPTGTAVFADASQARRGNTAAFLDLIPPSERKGLGLRLSYKLPHALEIYTTLLYSDVTGSSSGQPAAFAASATTGLGRFASIVPAAFNPFNKDVIVGMIAYEFGAIRQDVATESLNGTLGLTGNVGSTWRWDLSLAWQEQDFTRRTRDFNSALITAALANPDPLLRLDPFVDARAPGAPDQSERWETLARYLRFNGRSEQLTADFSADGELFDLRGGALRMAVGFYFEDATVSNRSVTPSLAVTPVDTITASEGSGEGVAVFSELMIPLYGKPNARPGLQRLDLQFALRHEDRGPAGGATVPKLGFSWVPVASVLLRAGYAEGFRAPGPTETMVQLNDFNNNAIIDPRRGNSVTSGVRVTREANPDLRPETSESLYYGILFEPTWLTGFQLDVSFYRTIQDDIIQVLTEQVLVFNESSFPDRVIRAAPDATDLANGWPGRITGVNRSLLNFGRAVNHSLDFMLHYRLPENRFGRFRFSLNASHTLRSTREVVPGVAAVNDLGDTFSPPKWRLSGSVSWARAPFNANLFVSTLSAFDSNLAGNFRASQAVPAQMTVDMRVGYELSREIVAGLGPGTRVSLGIGNLLDEKPPFADTIFGYNGTFQSPLGRTYQFSLTIPF
jgi:iron complex outermembrane recepter protein